MFLYTQRYTTAINPRITRRTSEVRPFFGSGAPPLYDPAAPWLRDPGRNRWTLHLSNHVLYSYIYLDI